ncbi:MULTISPECIES: phosphatase PAP2 family protein [unclassified Arthrobacter]|uniref:phosphatase PAP2 family protein n=1 Tax=unclassified Arthrobacter TaxID=235627 RepID=UPI0014910341|nr:MULTISPECIES: phosphatase PAP2 family protein [unclassified Arthrobacter]MBE0010120.1 phosphatase PAP2 family protein [Arthrobacter sp. AET 35A]NOJ64096.1 phosphatase PAP2 family protein [Arthrobacter sp. 147(2020)]
MAPSTSHHLTLVSGRTPVLLVALVALTVLAYPIREPVYRLIAETTEGSPFLSWTAAAVTEPGLVLLVVLTALIALWSWIRDRTVFWDLASGGVGVIGAYSLSEATKLIFTQERPCAVMDVATVLACPEAGDWSWPSNHSVVAAAFATACVLALPNFVWFVAPAATLIALSRVAVGVHYLHDTVAGVTLGVMSVLLSTTVLRGATARLKPPQEQANE